MAFIYFLIGAFAAIGLVALEGFVLACVWGWFAVPLGAPAVTVAQALGVSILSHILTSNWKSDSKQEVFNAETIIGKALSLVLVLAVSWLLSFLV